MNHNDIMNSKGLTLLEVLVSAMVISLIMLGLVSVFIGSKRYILSSRSQMAAAELGRYGLANLSMQVNQSSPWGSNCLSNSSCCTSPPPKILDGITYNITYNTSDLSVGSLRKAKVTITWNEPTP